MTIMRRDCRICAKNSENYHSLVLFWIQRSISQELLKVEANGLQSMIGTTLGILTLIINMRRNCRICAKIVKIKIVWPLFRLEMCHNCPKLLTTISTGKPQLFLMRYNRLQRVTIAANAP